jgi:hypothetical protein
MSDSEAKIEVGDRFEWTKEKTGDIWRVTMVGVGARVCDMIKESGVNPGSTSSSYECYLLLTRADLWCRLPRESTVEDRRAGLVVGALVRDLALLEEGMQIRFRWHGGSVGEYGVQGRGSLGTNLSGGGGYLTQKDCDDGRVAFLGWPDIPAGTVIKDPALLKAGMRVLHKHVTRIEPMELTLTKRPTEGTWKCLGWETSPGFSEGGCFMVTDEAVRDVGCKFLGWAAPPVTAAAPPAPLPWKPHPECPVGKLGHHVPTAFCMSCEGLIASERSPVPAAEALIADHKEAWDWRDRSVAPLHPHGLGNGMAGPVLSQRARQ